MKKLFLTTMLMWLCTGHYTWAQTVNKTYFNSLYHFQGTSIALLNKNSTKEVVVGSDAVNTSTNIANRYMLMKLNISGGVLNAMLVDSSYCVERVMETADSGFILVSDFYNYVTVRKYNGGMGLQWAKKYNKTNPGGGSTYYGGIDVEVVLDPQGPPGNNEYYYIICAEGTFDPVNYPYDEGLAVLKIDQMGNLQWHKVYTDVNRSSYNWWTIDMERGFSLTSFPDPNNPGHLLFALAGTRLFFDPFESESLFFMTIDENGSIVSQYKHYQYTSAQHYTPDIIYDGDSLVATYVQENDGSFPDPSQPSGYTVLKFDVGLNAFRTRYYWNDCENIPCSITTSSTDSLHEEIINDDGTFGDQVTYGTDKNYLIGGWVGKCYPNQNVYSTGTVAYLKVDRITLDPIQFKRYNVKNPAYERTFGFHRTDNYDYNYMPAFSLNTSPVTSSNGVKYLKTDPLLNACGARDFSVDYFDPEPTLEDFEFEAHDFNDQEDIIPQDSMISLVDDDCNNAADADQYKTTAVKAFIPRNFITQLWPTMVSNPSIKLNCKILSPSNTTINIEVVNAMGQVLQRSTQTIKAGENIFTIDAAILSTGVNLVRLLNNNTVLRTVKVNRLN